MIGSGEPPAARSLTHPFAGPEVTGDSRKTRATQDGKTGERGKTRGRGGDRSEASGGVAGTWGVEGRGAKRCGSTLCRGGVSGCETGMFMYGEGLCEKIGKI